MILVTGATGNVGREVVRLLVNGGENVVAVTRHLVTAALPTGARVVEGHPSHPQTLASALYGVDAVFISPRALGDATAGAATVELLKLAASRARLSTKICVGKRSLQSSSARQCLLRVSRRMSLTE
ncbi:SDR family oxidoreductase [Ktedonospora formicarum]|uniref:NAD(P)-binding domain-containing protein n=1 Tax=Ktedonospora formicarum TaxID=2778364 RepID=A0A8J3I2Y1_9CHLR|nr:NAD(P)H-binding protein [Ktedonospora formicarum]GHO45743.1 hypothetical protein KSX_39060 [Ktedonospora formicarum]